VSKISFILLTYLSQIALNINIDWSSSNDFNIKQKKTKCRYQWIKILFSKSTWL